MTESLRKDETVTQLVSRDDTRSNATNGHRTDCFYCGEPEGQPHKFECVCHTKKVKVRYSWEVERDVPASWDTRDIEFYMNEGSWCADNAIDDLHAMFCGDDSPCSCPVFLGEVIEQMESNEERDA